MSQKSPLNDLLAATLAALKTARGSFGAPVVEIDHALAELSKLELATGRTGNPSGVVKNYLPSDGVLHPEANGVLKSLYAVAGQLPWISSFYPEDGFDDVSRFADGYACSMVITDPRYADSSLASSRSVSLNFTVQAPHTIYPDHAHTAVELYYVISGKAHWKRGSEPWVTRYPGDVILHPTGMRHAMQTGDEPLVASAVWVSHTDAPVVIVRA